MGRPKLYHTAEQRKEAKQLKNARHYLKYHSAHLGLCNLPLTLI